MPPLLPTITPSALNALEALELPTWLMDLEGQFLWANPAAIAFWKVPTLDTLKDPQRFDPSGFEPVVSQLQSGGSIQKAHTFVVEGKPVQALLYLRGVRFVVDEQDSEQVLGLAQVAPVPNSHVCKGVSGLLENSAILFSVFDMAGRPLFENDVARRMFPSKGDGSRPNLEDRFAGTDLLKKLGSGLKEGKSVQQEVGLSTATGTRWHLLEVRTVPYESQTALLLLATDIHDLTEARMELKAAKELAESASRSKSEFLANMSHEVRTPMNGVVGSLELLAKTELSQEQSRLLGTVQRSAQTLLAILNDILDLSRIEAGKLTLESTDFNFAQTLEDVCEIHRGNATKKGLVLELEIAPGVPNYALGDPVRVSQVLGNLISNAIKFTATGSVRVEVDFAEKSPIEFVPRISVVDTGRGIEKAQMDRIFRAFEQEDGSITRKFGGTGLGLTISAQLAKFMGGSIMVESEAGMGSRFTFTCRLSLRSEAGDTFDIEPSVSLVSAKAGIFDPHLRLDEFRVALKQGGATIFDLCKIEREVIEKLDLSLVVLDLEAKGADSWLSLERAFHRVGWLSRPPAEKPEGLSALFVGSIAPKNLFVSLMRLMGEQQKVQAPIDNSGVSLKDRKILVVEDNPINQEVAVGMLEGFHCTVRCAEHGAEALELLRSESFDVILLDCQMPVMDGFSASREIRKLEAERGGRLPIIALTANAMQGDRERCLEAGMDDFLAKPFSINQLEQMLKSWV